MRRTSHADKNATNTSMARVLAVLQPMSETYAIGVNLQQYVHVLWPVIHCKADSMTTLLLAQLVTIILLIHAPCAAVRFCMVANLMAGVHHAANTPLCCRCIAVPFLLMSVVGQWREKWDSYQLLISTSTAAFFQALVRSLLPLCGGAGDAASGAGLLLLPSFVVLGLLLLWPRFTHDFPDPKQMSRKMMSATMMTATPMTIFIFRLFHHILRRRARPLLTKRSA